MSRPTRAVAAEVGEIIPRWSKLMVVTTPGPVVVIKKKGCLVVGSGLKGKYSECSSQVVKLRS